MKRFIPLLALFAAGVVASFAVASPPPGHGHQNTSASSTSTGEEHGKSGEHGSAKCHPVNLKGTVANGTIALNVTKASGGKNQQLSGTTANLTVSGDVSVQAWSCGAASSTGGSAAPQTLYLKQLHVGGSPHNFGSTTTTTGP
jgi:hypothetical protein